MKSYAKTNLKYKILTSYLSLNDSQRHYYKRVLKKLYLFLFSYCNIYMNKKEKLASLFYPMSASKHMTRFIDTNIFSYNSNRIVYEAK